MRLDCHRLASFSHERANASAEAFRWGYDGLQAAKEMPADVIATSALPYLGAALARLCEPAGKEGLRDEIVQSVAELTGDPKWLDAFESSAA